MTRAALLAVAMFIAACASDPEPASVVVQPQSVTCASADQMAAVLASRFGETPHDFGITELGALFQIYRSQKGSWSAVLTVQTGVSCLIAAGESWERVDQDRLKRSVGARQWIHENFPMCCDHRDCHPYAGRVAFDGQFYMFDWKGQEVRWHERDAKQSPDSNYYVCQMPYDFTPRCFFRPPMGA